MFIDSGGVKEYCQEFGIEYTKLNFEERINFILKNYRLLSEKMRLSIHLIQISCQKEFLNLFLEMYEKKDILLNERIIEKSTFLEKKLYKIKRYLKKLRTTNNFF